MSSSRSNPSPDHEGDDGDDFVMLDEPLSLSVRTRDEARASEPLPSIRLNSFKSSNAFLLTVEPPSKPVKDIKHVSCDIVLVIDVSGSMAELAPLPDVEDEQERESSGLTVLDLVRHACRTIISTLNDSDRLALVTFSQDSKVVQPLTNMTEMVKAQTLEKVEGLKDEGATNLWAGIRAGLQQFEYNPPVGNVQGLYVLTDGQPNYMCPQQGYIPKMQPLLQELLLSNGSAPSIQTFGFGYSIRSDLMLSIAKVGNGNFAFIPEVGMIGTVFVHAVANLYATYASNASLELSLAGASVADLEHNSGLPVDRPDSTRLIINLGNLQYGQPRDLLINHPSVRSLAKTPITVKLVYAPHSQSQRMAETTFLLNQPAKMTQSTFNYHVQRNNLCSFFSTLYPIDPVKREHTTIAIADVDSARAKFQALVEEITSIPAYKSDPDISSLLSDLIGTSMDPKSPGQGQVYQALQTAPQTKDGRITKSYWHKWGRHYLSSLWCAHMRQTCNTFKDPGPIRYGTKSELFQRCRDELDAAFDNLPAPVGTYTSYMGGLTTQHQSAGGSRSRSRGMQVPGASVSIGRGLTTMMTSPQIRAPISMSRYNRRDNVCFLGTCMIKLSDGQYTMLRDLRPGDELYSPIIKTTSKVIEIVKSTYNYNPHQQICRIATNLWITPWHPILHPQDNTWTFPHSLAEDTRPLQPHESVYSILLDPSTDLIHHAIEVEGVICTTLGHGVIDSDTDCRAHPFFGDYTQIARNLALLPQDQQGRRLCDGLTRSSRSGLACGMFNLDQPTARL